MAFLCLPHVICMHVQRTAMALLPVKRRWRNCYSEGSTAGSSTGGKCFFNRFLLASTIPTFSCWLSRSLAKLKKWLYFKFCHVWLCSAVLLLPLVQVEIIFKMQTTDIKWLVNLYCDLWRIRHYKRLSVQDSKVNDPTELSIYKKMRTIVSKAFVVSQVSKSQLCVAISDRWPNTHWRELEPTSTALHQTTKTVVRLIWPSLNETGFNCFH